MAHPERRCALPTPPLNSCGVSDTAECWAGAVWRTLRHRAGPHWRCPRCQPHGDRAPEICSCDWAFQFFILINLKSCWWLVAIVLDSRFSSQLEKTDVSFCFFKVYVFIKEANFKQFNQVKTTLPVLWTLLTDWANCADARRLLTARGSRGPYLLGSWGGSLFCLTQTPLKSGGFFLMLYNELFILLRGNIKQTS